MKKPVCLFIALFSLLATNAQKIDSASVHRLSPGEQDQVYAYLSKAKNSKTAAMALCIGGGTLSIIGIIVNVTAVEKDVWGDGKDPNTDGGSALILAGTLLGLGSIPLFVNSHNQANKARAIVFADKGVGLKPGTLLPNTQTAGIRIIIPLGK